VLVLFGRHLLGPELFCYRNAMRDRNVSFIPPV